MSKLFQRMMKNCVTQVRRRVPDGEGGSTEVWADGEAFKAAIVKKTDLAAQIAEKSSETVRFTVSTDRLLSFHEVFKRVSDGATFRVVAGTDESSPPAEASFTFYQAEAERWEETT